MKFLILTQSYSDNDGGYIALHKLCDQINRCGGSAYLFPYVDCYEISQRNLIKPILKIFKEKIRRLAPFKVNKEFLTPILNDVSKIENWSDWVVVYPEVVFGNPLNAKNIVRWFLHHPGHISGKIYYGRNELYYSYHSGIKPYVSNFSKLSNSELKIFHFPLDLYNEDNASEERTGTAYCIRKGKGKIIQHDISDSILIDGKSHKEISKIFKKVKQFISYDVYTAYSSFAVLCGCDSIVVPDKGVSEEEWLPNPTDRFGISYGFQNIVKSKLTRDLVLPRMKKELENNSICTKILIHEAAEFFGLERG